MIPLAKLIVSFFYVGFLRPAPGTWGSAAALPAAWVLHTTGGFPTLAIATVFCFFLGVWATGVWTAHTGGQDPSEVVIDEVAGQWVALWPLSAGLWLAGAGDLLAAWPGWVGAFVLFRLFDIWKPGLVGWADRQHGALGVMLDDIFAGAMAAIIVLAAAALAHGWLG